MKVHVVFVDDFEGLPEEGPQGIGYVIYADRVPLEGFRERVEDAGKQADDVWVYCKRAAYAWEIEYLVDAYYYYYDNYAKPFNPNELTWMKYATVGKFFDRAGDKTETEVRMDTLNELARINMRIHHGTATDEMVKRAEAIRKIPALELGGVRL